MNKNFIKILSLAFVTAISCTFISAAETKTEEVQPKGLALPVITMPTQEETIEKTILQPAEDTKKETAEDAKNAEETTKETVTEIEKAVENLEEAAEEVKVEAKEANAEKTEIKETAKETAEKTEEVKQAEAETKDVEVKEVKKAKKEFNVKMLFENIRPDVKGGKKAE